MLDRISDHDYPQEDALFDHPGLVQSGMGNCIFPPIQKSSI